MPLGVNSAAKASDDEGTHIGEGADDAPGIEPFYISHDALLMWFVGCFFMAC